MLRTPTALSPATSHYGRPTKVDVRARAAYSLVAGSGEAQRIARLIEWTILRMAPSMYRDDNPAEEQGAALLTQLFARLVQASARSEAFEVRGGSQLASDDAATAYDPISYQVRFFFGAAFDHTFTLQRTITDHGMPMVAAYPLIRAAIEAAAQVLWLTTGGTKAKRVYRALHRVWDMATMSEGALQHLIPDRKSPLDTLRVRLDGLLRSAGAGQRSLDRDYPTMTDIVIDAGRFVRSRRFTPIDVWRLCSSMAHGNREVATAILESREEGPRTSIGSTYLMTTSYQTVAAFVGVLVETVEAALESLERRNAA